MTVLLGALLAWLLARSEGAMASALTACKLFAFSVMPGLFPYMTLALMLTSRLPRKTPSAVLVLVGWCGGSPTGARLLALRPGMPAQERLRVAVTCATMSPMFLMGTVPLWTGSRISGIVLLTSVLLGGWVTGWLAGTFPCADAEQPEGPDAAPLSLTDAVMTTARTMLLVCGTMMLLRVLADLVGEVLARWPVAQLTLMSLLEVTSGTAEIAALPLSLAVRIGLIAGATGFGGAAIVLQNHAAYPAGLLTFPRQLLWQVVHGLVSGLLAFGLMLLSGQ